MRSPESQDITDSTTQDVDDTSQSVDSQEVFIDTVYGNQFEDTELEQLRRQYSQTSRRRAQGPSPRPATILQRIIYTIHTFWKNQISTTVAHETCRDHLALERTFLGYLRTSLVLSMMGAIVAQLFRLQHVPTPDPHFGFFIIGKPLAYTCHGGAIIVTLTGAYRSWRVQNAMMRGKAISGGFEIILIGSGVLVMLVTFFVLVLVVDIKKTHF